MFSTDQVTEAVSKLLKSKEKIQLQTAHTVV